MTLPRTVADVLAEHVAFEVECIDRMYLNVYVPAAAVRRRADRLRAAAAGAADRLDRAAGEDHRRGSRRRCTASRRDHQVPWVDFAKGQRKDDVMHEHLAAFEAAGGPRAWCSSAGRRRRPPCSGPRSAATPRARRYPWIVKSTGVVNHFYFYCVDEDFGPFFLKFCSYFPVQCEAVRERPPLGPTPGRPRPPVSGNSQAADLGCCAAGVISRRSR